MLLDRGISLFGATTVQGERRGKRKRMGGGCGDTGTEGGLSQETHGDKGPRIASKATHSQSSGRFHWGKPFGANEMSSPGLGPGLSRPRRDVLTTRRFGISKAWFACSHTSPHHACTHLRGEPCNLDRMARHGALTACRQEKRRCLAARLSKHLPA